MANHGEGGVGKSRSFSSHHHHHNSSPIYDESSAEGGDLNGSSSRQGLLSGERNGGPSSSSSGSLDGSAAVRRRTPPPSSSLGGVGGGREEHHGGHYGGASSAQSAVTETRLADFQQARRDTKEKNARAARALTLAIVFCFVFMVAEALGGILSNSLAVLTDAAHMLTDVAALSLALFAIHASGRPADEKYSYGWQRAEAVGALASVFTIWALVGGIVFSAISRIISDVKCARHPHGEGNVDHTSGCESVDAIPMFGIGCAGLVANMCCAAILAWGGAAHSHSHGGGGGGHGHSHGGGHSHSSSHSHSAKCDEGKKQQHSEENLNVRGAFLHALGDCIQSAGVIIAAIFIWVYNERVHGSSAYAHSWGNLADPCCSILFGAITLYTTINLFKDLLRILMQGTPGGISMHEVMEALVNIPGVQSVHDLHIWSLTTDADSIVLSVHLVAEHSRSQEVLEAAQKVLSGGITEEEEQGDAEETEDERERLRGGGGGGGTRRSGGFGIHHTTIQIDSPSAKVSACSTAGHHFHCVN